MNERDRIELLMKCYNLSPSQFADRTGIQRASVSHILSGRNKPSLEVMLKIYDAFPDLDMKWLMVGVGEAPVAESAKGDGEVSVGLFGNLEEDTKVEIPLLLNDVVQDVDAKKRGMQTEKALKEATVARQVEKSPRKPSQARMALQNSVVQRKIKEIRIFYTDGTYETLVPEK